MLTASEAKKLWARRYINPYSHDPKAEGIRLALTVLDKDHATEECYIDIRELPPELLISVFFTGFYETLIRVAPSMTDKITWISRFPFQQNIAKIALGCVQRYALPPAELEVDPDVL